MKSRNILPLIILINSLFSLVSCGNDNNEKISYEDYYFDISLKQDKTLTLHSLKEDNKYTLTIEGSGEAIDYTRKEETPWYPISKRVSDVIINDGILNIGNYYFASLNIDYVILPSSVNKIGDNSFSKNTTIYTYGSELSNADNAYYYSESKPENDGKYFHIVDNKPYIWKDASILFIGNSFTFRQGSESNPSVPNYFKSIAENLSQDVEIDYVLRGSYTLTKYANKTDELGSVVETKLTSNQYDYVVLQEQSTTPVNSYNAFLTAVKTLNTRIQETQKNCKVILYETWGTPYNVSEGSFKSVEAMELLLRDAYEKAGNEIDASVTYVGKAFTYVYTNYSSIGIYADDNRHQSNLGAYLSAACHVKNIFGLDVSKCTDYCSLDESNAKTLLNIANNII